jgi:methylated-DNA-protein-cysteine methyltransferase-like protein
MSPYDPLRHGPRRIVGPGFHAAVWDLVRAVPRGAVTTYGDLAAALGSRRVARQVGWALAALPDGSDVPWWRVVGGQGTVARAATAAGRRQRRLLRGEGIATRGGRVVGFARRRAVLRAPG